MGVEICVNCTQQKVKPDMRLHFSCIRFVHPKNWRYYAVLKGTSDTSYFLRITPRAIEKSYRLRCQQKPKGSYTEFLHDVFNLRGQAVIYVPAIPP